MAKDFKTGEFNPRSFKKNGSAPRKSFTEEIMDIDSEIIRLISKRIQLVGKIRGGKGHAATPRAIKDEKQVRASWEEKVARISRDQNFNRQLFNLVHELEATPRPDDTALSLYNLAPVRFPVKIERPGPALWAYSCLWATLGVMYGKRMTLNGINRTQSVLDYVKAFAQAGADFSWHEAPCLELAVGKVPVFAGKSIFVGEDTFTLSLLAFIAAGSTGRVSFTGGKRLKASDLSIFHKFMPLLGARMAWVIPGSKSVPAVIECSGMLPESVSIPAEFSYLDILALFIAALTWQRQIVLKFDGANTAAVLIALSLLQPILKTFPAAVTVHEAEARFTSWGSEACVFPDVIEPLLDPAWSSMLLAMPFFAGGTVTLFGKWADVLASSSSIALLRQTGLKVTLERDFVRATQVNATPSASGISCRELPPCLHPLFWAINGRIVLKNKHTVILGEYPDAADLRAGADFLAQIGVRLELQDDKVALAPPAQEESLAPAAKSYGWTSVAPEWALAFSLLAFLKANLKITNPDIATEAIPDYWELYNSLPEPKAPSAKAEQPVATNIKGRRRIRAIYE